MSFYIFTNIKNKTSGECQKFYVLTSFLKQEGDERSHEVWIECHKTVSQLKA